MAAVEGEVLDLLRLFVSSKPWKNVLEIGVRPIVVLQLLTRRKL